MKNKRKPSNANNYILSGIFFLSISSIFMVAARFHPTFAQWYSTHIYPIFVSIIGRLSSMVSFSFVELSLYVMSLLIIGTGIHALASARKNRKNCSSSMDFCTISRCMHSILSFCDQLRHQLSKRVLCRHSQS